MADEKSPFGWGSAPSTLPKISAETLARARHGKNRKVEPTKIFEPYKPAPGVLPKGIPTLAMDDQIIEVAGWASQVGLNSAFQEGTTFLGYSYLAELAQRPEYRAITEVIAYEMTREWIEFKTTGDEDKTEKIQELEEAMSSFNVQQVFREVAIHDGFFGRGHIYLDTGDTDEKDELKSSIGPGKGTVSKQKVNTRHPLRALRTVEPVWTYPTQYDSNNPLKGDWYRPTTWFVMGQELHATRLLTFVGREVPDLLKPAYAFGGLSMSQMAKPYVDNWLRTRQSVADIVHAFSVMVLKTNLQALLQAGGAELFSRIDLFNLARDNRGVMAVDKDTEDFSNVSAPLGGLDGLQASTQEHIASVSRIPLVKLLGIQPAGLNASSEGEIRSFYDWIASFQEHLFRKHLDRVIDSIQLSIWGEVDQGINYDFKSLWQLDEAGKAGVQQTIAATIATYVEMGAIDPAVAAKVTANDPDSPFKGIDLEDMIPPEAPMEGEEGLLGGQPGDPGGPSPQAQPGGGGPMKAPSTRGGVGNVTRKAASMGGITSGDGENEDDRIIAAIPIHIAQDDANLAHAEVGFEHPAKGPHSCSECEHYGRPAGPHCELVADPIAPGDWCELFKLDAALDAAE